MWNAFLRRLRQDPIQTMVLSGIFIIHSFFVLWMVFSPQLVLHKKKRPSLIVKTVAAKPLATEKKNPRSSPVPAQTVAAKKQEPMKTQPKTPNPSTAKKEIVKPKPEVKKEPAIADKTLNKSKATPVKKSAPQRANISDSLLKELEDSIAQIDQKPDKILPKLKSQTPISLQIDNPLHDTSSDQMAVDYAETLVNQLHASLSLPEFGEVKIQLSLRQDGTVVKLVVLKTQSEKNKQYLENALPRLKFPRFEGTYANKKEYTFILTFCNE